MKATSDFLDSVVERKRSRLADAMKAWPLEILRAHAYKSRRDSPVHALSQAMVNDETINVIAEIKRASPSKGELRPGDINPADVARAYERGGATAVSVLTEQDYFRGSLTDLSEVREAIALPVLRKDFIFDEYQLYESAAAGADAVLLIVALLEDSQLRQLRTITEDELGMDALVEVHDATELARATHAGAKLIGVNNRNLRSFEVSLDVSFELAQEKPANATLVSESGLSTREQLRSLRAVGYQGFLIGERLMTSNDPEAYLRALVDAE